MVSMIEFTVNADGLEEFLEKKGEMIVAALRADLHAETTNLLSYIKDDKLSGQVLHQRTGNLKNSAFTTFEDTEESLLGTVSFGRTVPYAAIHNYGGKIEIPEVTDKLMVFEARSPAYKPWAGIFDSVAQSKALVFTRKHRAFTVQMPARNYMESSLEEKRPEIVAGLQDAVNEAAAS